MNDLLDKSANIDYTEKCPNCGENTYHNLVCENCGIWKTDEYLNSDVWKQFIKTWEQIKDNFEEEKIKIKVNYLNYSSYKIILINWKINEIKFKVNKKDWKSKKFRIIIDYNVVKKQIKETDFYETEKQEREKIFNVNKYNKIYIKLFQEKAKVWYKDKKHPNYYKFMGINIENILNFIKKVIEKYHDIY